MERVMLDNESENSQLLSKYKRAKDVMLGVMLDNEKLSRENSQLLLKYKRAKDLLKVVL
jgi:hypothetical protein